MPTEWVFTVLIKYSCSSDRIINLHVADYRNVINIINPQILFLAQYFTVYVDSGMSERYLSSSLFGNQCLNLTDLKKLISNSGEWQNSTSLRISNRIFISIYQLWKICGIKREIWIQVLSNAPRIETRGRIWKYNQPKQINILILSIPLLQDFRFHAPFSSQVSIYWMSFKKQQGIYGFLICYLGHEYKNFILVSWSHIMPLIFFKQILPLI